MGGYLTQIHDRDALLERAESEVLRIRRYGRSMTLLILEVDNHQDIRSSHGDAWLEMVTRIIGLVCRETLREPDILGHLGDHCLAFILPEADEAAGVQLAHRLIEALSQIRLPAARGLLSFTVSVGVATTVGEVAALDGVIDGAQRQLRAAQSLGGNRFKGCFVGDRREVMDEALVRLGRRNSDAEDTATVVELTHEELDHLLRRGPD